MSQRNKKIFLALLLLSVAVFCIFSAPQILDFVTPHSVPVEMMPTPDPLEAKLNNLASRYKNGEISVIDISTITTFSWDQLYIFGQYTDFPTLDSVVGWSWWNTCSDQVSIMSSSDAYTFLVFTNKGTVVHCLMYPREYDFYIPEKTGYVGGYSPQEALFVLDDLGRLVVKDTK